jgi:hypothetical protein
VIVDLPEYSVNQITQWMRINLGKKYDWLGLFGFVWRRQKGASKRYFCSEAVAEMLGFDDAWRFDPMNLYQALSRENKLK